MGAFNSTNRSSNPPENSTSPPTTSPASANSSDEIFPPANTASQLTPAEEEEEEGECGFCVFMKGGPCKGPFTAWQECVEKEEREDSDVVAKCSEITRAMKECVEANPAYYGPILEAEKKMKERAEDEKNAAA
ncbi:hypothetical protein LINGRAHAP2_LOCUS18550 [Linum grandiflorum]